MIAHECHTGCDCHESARTLELDRLRAQVDEAMRAGAEIALTLALVRGICNDADDAASDPDCAAQGILARGRFAREILEILP